MQRFSVFSYKCRAALALAAFALPALLQGCGTVSYAPGPDFSPETHDYLRADDSAAFAACTAMCMEDTALALVTRTGCLEGCLETQTRFTLHNKAFPARQDCLDALLQEDVAREKRITEMKRWCDAKWSHVHNRKGCYLAAERFYASLTPGSVCGSDAVESTRYDEDLKRAQEEAAKIPPEPQAGATPTEPEPVPSPEPSAEAAPATPAVPVTAQSPEAAPVTHATQPAGPLDPPPYAAPQHAEQPGTAPRPEIRDTPKYQKTPPVKREAPATKPTPPTAEPETLPAKAPGTAKAEPKPKPVVETLPKAPEQPVPAKEPEQPVETQPQQNASPDPTPVQEAAKPEPVTAEPVTPVPAEAPSVPSEPSKIEVPGTGIPETKAPVANEPLPENTPAKRDGPPVPGLNANRPIPPTRENVPEKSGNPVLMPPVPSMLDKPYETPTIISPQIDVPGN